MTSLVETTYGMLRGAESGGVWSFLGVPYGAPTGGPARFQPPMPPAPWSGTRDATRIGPACPQPTIPGTEPHLPPGEVYDEDCLVLNVWTPQPGDGGGRPVLVWFHGGGFTTGSGSWPVYDGTALARRWDVVVVTVNHRLGVLGHLFLEELGGDRYASSGNAGILDLCAALEWVKANISAFGGDPTNVTVFGESGGGAKVSVLLALPSAQGLFHRAIIQSGPTLSVSTAEEAARHAREVLGEVRVGSLEELQQVTPDALISAEQTVARRASQQVVGAGQRRPRGLSPVVDGVALPVQPVDAIARGLASDVPLIIGTNRDEGTILTWASGVDLGSVTFESLPHQLDETTGGLGHKLVDAYRSARPNASASDIFVAIQGDRMMRMPSIRLVEARVTSGASPTFMYLFCWDDGGPLGAAHALEIAFVFDNLGRFLVPEITPDRQVLAEQMSGGWVSFARTGRPDHPGLDEWPTYSLESRATMIFDRECRVEEDPLGDVRHAWETVDLVGI